MRRTKIKYTIIYIHTYIGICTILERISIFNFITKACAIEINTSSCYGFRWGLINTCVIRLRMYIHTLCVSKHYLTILSLFHVMNGKLEWRLISKNYALEGASSIFASGMSTNIHVILFITEDVLAT